MDAEMICGVNWYTSPALVLTAETSGHDDLPLSGGP
jgi:hypothetical protein